LKTVKTFLPLIAASASFLLMGCSTGGSQNGTPALFNTKAEAEKAARDFNCTGAHQMGDKWMPCKSHKDHQGHKKQGGHGHHHH
tara:strand:+ start:685 stop:936 length:252 start_codon:yes stop_codon:yes gene_type:complete